MNINLLQTWLHFYSHESNFRVATYHIRSPHESLVKFSGSNHASFVSVDQERIALGTEDGLFVVEVTRDGESRTQTDRQPSVIRTLTSVFVSPVIVRAADSKKVYQIDLIPKEKTIALLCGRNRQVHLHPWEVLEGAESIFDVKMADTKNCQALTTGVLRPGGPACLLAAVKRQVRLSHWGFQ